MASTPVAAPPPNPSSSTTDPSSSPPPEESKPSPPPKESESETSPPPQESKSPPPTPPPPSTPPPSPIPTPKSPPSNTSTSPPKSLPPPSPPTSNIPPLSPPPLPPPVTTTPPSPASQIPSPPSPILTPSSPGVLFSPPQLPTTPSDSNFPPPNAPVRKPSPHTPSSSTVDDTSGKLPLIIGITAGVGILFIFMIVIFMLCFRKKKRLPMNNQVQYYGNPPGSKGPGYYDTNSSKHQSWYPNNNQQMMEHGSNRMAAPPPGVFVAPPGSGWANQHHLNSSSEYGSHLSDPPHVMGLPASPSSGFSVNKSSFTYDELAAATNGFSQANLLGQGGFGYVHKGVLPDGKVVAVKSLKSGSGQGEREFQAEVEIISRVHHRHLVSLVGYCIAGGQRMLVYEFVPNKTMEYHLHGKGHPPMDWPKRLKIALGAAKGLAYLHEDCHPRIIHRDIKAANILIDNNFEAMVADFGLAKLTSDTYTHVSTRIMGTFGYLAPEYASSGKLTDKSDVFSFGVMLLELITGRRPVDISNSYMEDSLVDWARPLLTRNDRDYRDLVDPTLEGNYDINEMSCMVACAAASIRHSSRKRPKMSQIVRTLEGDLSLEMLNEGVKPGQSTTFTSSEQESYNANLKKFKKMAMEGTSEEIGSEYSGITSTYGLNPSSTSDSSSGEVVNQVPPRRLHP